MTTTLNEPPWLDELLRAFERVVQGDFTPPLQRNYRRDTQDLVAYFVNLMAEEYERILGERVADRLAIERAQARAAEHVRLQAILDSMADGVLVIDRDGGVIQANRALERLLELPAAPPSGTPAATLFADPGEIGRLLARLARGEVASADVDFRTRTGTPLTLAVRLSAQRDPEGALTAAVIVARDDRELREARARLRLSDRMVVMGTLAAGVAHEINNPLAFTWANLEFVREALASADVAPGLREALEDARTGVTRVTAITRDLKMFSRHQEDASESLDVREVLDSALRMMSNELRHRARIVRRYEAVPRLAGHSTRLAQVFLNLLQNAAQAMPEGRADVNVLTISVAPAAGGLAVAVADTGCGIPAALRSRLFEPFFTTKASGEGTGLGLAICHRIVTSMGGRIDVESEPGCGTTVTVELPLGATPVTVPGEGPTSPAADRRRRILVVDDEPAIRRVLVRVLGDAHEVVVAASGREALAALSAGPFDLVLCDVMMPEMLGTEVLEAARGLVPGLEDRFVFMTGGTFSTGVREALQRLPNAQLEKPFDLGKLREVIGRLAAG